MSTASLLQARFSASARSAAEWGLKYCHEGGKFPFPCPITPDRPQKKRKRELRSLTPLSLPARVDPTNLRITPADQAFVLQHESLFSCVLRFAQCVSFERCKRLARQAVDTEPTTTRPVTKVPVAFRHLRINEEAGTVGRGYEKSPETRTKSAFQGLFLWRKEKKRRFLKIQAIYASLFALASPRGFEPLSTA